MLMSREFLFGLSAYVRQAELSLHRTPKNDLEALIIYYADNHIPLPHEVLRQLDRHLPGGDLAVKGPLRAAVGLLTGRLSMVNGSHLLALRKELDEYGRLLRHEYRGTREANNGGRRVPPLGIRTDKPWLQAEEHHRVSPTTDARYSRASHAERISEPCPSQFWEASQRIQRRWVL